MICIFKEILLFEKSYSKSKFEYGLKSNASSCTYIIIFASYNFFFFFLLKEIINIIALILTL